MNVFITGGANGIGKRTAVKLVEKGHEVMVFDKDGEALKNLDRSIKTYQGNVKNLEELKEAMERFEVEVLVNCAGIQERGAVEDLGMDSYEEHIENNYLGMVRATKEAMTSLRRNEGRIINISSVAGLSGVPFLSAYTASKFAMEGFSDCLRMELSGSEIEVVIVEPGPIQTGFNERGIAKYRDFIPSSRYSDEYSKRLDREVERADVGKAAERIVEAIEAEKPKTRYTVTKIAYLTSKLKPFVPDRLWDKLVKHAY